MKRHLVQLAIAGLTLLCWACSRGDASASPVASAKPPAHTETVVLAGGCFWCLEAAYDDVSGVVEAVSGYTGGHKPNPTYQEVSAGDTGHYEAVRVTFDPAKTSLAKILDVFWRQIDPTDPGGQFADRGPNYRTAIFVADAGQRRLAETSKKALEATAWFKKPIVTEILPAGPFYAAEAHHQNYDDKNPTAYKAYKWGSGRGPFLEETWKGKPSILVPPPARTYVKPSDEELRKRLTPLQYDVTQHGATERAFANEYWNNHEAGIYVDIVSGEPLFSSTDKFESGTGWPSFSKPLVDDNVVRSNGSTAAYAGAEVHSRVAGSHLGHVFGDGPKPTGLRYCIDSASLRFIPAAKLEAEGYGEFASTGGR